MRIATGRRLDRLYGTQGPLARALVVADQHDLDKDLRERFADAGIIHMVSVSGLHISIIGSALLGLLLACGISAPRASFAGIICIVAYVIFIGAPPPAVRSAVMFSSGGVCLWLQRPTSVWAIWAVSCGVSLVDPWIVLDLGWQLSAAGMAGLIASGILIERVGVAWKPASRAVISGVTATAIASLVTTPIIAWTFERVSIAACLTNLAAAPLFNVAQPLLFLSVIASLVWPLGQFIADAARSALLAVDLVARVGAALPFAVVRAEADVVTALALVVVAVCAVACCITVNRKAVISCGLAAVSCVAWWPAVRPGNGQLEIHVIDVGQGDAIAVRSPKGRWLLIDAGRAWPGGDAGQRVVWPYLRRRGGDVVHLAMSHPHLDHIGGVESLLKRTHVDTLWDSGFPATSTAYASLLRESRSAGTVWRHALAGDSLAFDGVTIRVLFPTAEWLAAQHDANNASLVLQLVYGGTQALLTGDAEQEAERALVSRYGAGLQSDVLKLGHHGSSTSSTVELLDAVAPTIAVMSVGVLNDYGHPSPVVLQRLIDRGVNVLRTDDDGTIVLSSDGRSFTLSSGSNRW
jgi:competence protein ComEC